MSSVKELPVYETRPHRVINAYEADGGWVMRLACGHVIWSAVYVNPSYCGKCLDELTERAKRGGGARA